MIIENIPNRYQRTTLIMLSLLLISIISSVPFVFFNKIYFQHDYVFHISRLEAYFESIKQLNFFPNIFYQLGHGGGYATDLFYPSILLLPYALIRLCGINMSHSFMVFYFLMNLFIAYSSYSLGYYLFKNIRSGILLSTVYTLSTYRFHDAVIRGAIGELFGFIFIPIALIGLHSILYGNKKKWYLLTLSMSLLIISHLLSAFMLFFFIVFFSIVKFVSSKNWQDSIKRFIVLCISGFWSLLLSLWHILPIMEQSSHMVFNYNTTHLNLPTLNFLQVVKEAYHSNITGFPAPTNNIGTFLILSIIVLWIFFIKLGNYSRLGLIFTTFILYLTSSSFPWDKLQQSILKTIQFPYRLNLFSTLIASILLVYVIKTKAKNNLIIFLFLILSCSFFALRLNFSFKPEFKEQNIAQYYNDPTSFGGGQEYVKKGYLFPTVVPSNGESIEIEKTDDLQLFKATRDHNELTITGNINQDMTIKTPFLYYYGYRVTDTNGKKIACFEKDGRVAFKFPKGKHTVSIVYKRTFIQIFSALISLISLLFFIGLLFTRTPKTNHRLINSQ